MTKNPIGFCRAPARYRRVYAADAGFQITPENQTLVAVGGLSARGLALVSHGLYPGP